MRRLVPALLLAIGLPAFGGSVTGHVIDKSTGAGIVGMEVRVWTPVYVTDPGKPPRIKSWSFSDSPCGAAPCAMTTTTGGAYAFGGLSGPVLIDTRGNGATEYTDRWYAAGESSNDL